MKLRKQENETRLQRFARRWINEKADDYNGDAQAVINDLMKGGCASGMVGELVYYRDTLPFYLRHRVEINTMLAETLSESGCKLKELLNCWDESDPLALEMHNQNLLAWFGFETAAFSFESN